MKGANGGVRFKTSTLVDQVEERLINFIKESQLKPGDSLPNETQLSQEMGISRNVIREAMSRLRMLGLIQSRTKRGHYDRRTSLICGIGKGDESSSIQRKYDLWHH